jgi:hypothetical protein
MYVDKINSLKNDISNEIEKHTNIEESIQKDLYDAIQICDTYENMYNQCLND